MRKIPPPKSSHQGWVAIVSPTPPRDCAKAAGSMPSVQDLAMDSAPPPRPRGHRTDRRWSPADSGSAYVCLVAAQLASSTGGNEATSLNRELLLKANTCCGFLTLGHGVGAYSDLAFLQTCACCLKDFSLRIYIGRYKGENSLSQLQMMQIYRFFGDLSKVSLEPWRWLSLLLPLVGVEWGQFSLSPPRP